MIRSPKKVGYSGLRFRGLGFRGLGSLQGFSKSLERFNKAVRGFHKKILEG